MNGNVCSPSPSPSRAGTPRRNVALLLCALVAAFIATDAHAEWPPAQSVKSMEDPKFWPNDPGYAYSETSDGQWNFYSFMPSTAKGVRAEEKTSGMSIDLAWRYTIGDPAVVLAVTDSGIEWENDDLIEKVYLNAAELANHKPLHTDSSPCGGDGALAGFDCNGDGFFTVGDYKDTPNLLPEASDGHPKGDKNGNGVLDAGDLILNYSDGVDDDNNGYIDDIAGWDFLKDDNDPYDDTRYGHGTGEARDSTAATNNMIGDAGVCPLCRFMPMRVGDSFITDVTLFGKAIVYATDNGASVIQCALGTINMNTFTQRALDYAYGKGVLAVTSMADENSKHHNMPSAANHTLPVHAIQYDGSSLATATTFFSFHPCSNYGGQNFLSASGTSCSSEATGRLSGIAGLLLSASRKYELNPPLHPGEAHSIFFTTVDDIDVAESRVEESIYRYSQPGFDQRFGYGRVNANRAVEALKAGRIPPVVDITSPTWFTVLYKDQAQGTIDIQGTISAKRAKSYDYYVEVAPGVQPLDGEFKVYASQKNVSADMVTGGSDDDPITKLEIRGIDPKHERDVDSLRGENDTAVTLRVRAVAHYGGKIGDVAGEMRRTYYIQTDPSLVRGFPIYLGDSGELSAKMADLDGDGVRDLIVPTAGGVLHAYKITGDGPKELPGFPFRTEREDGLRDPAPTPQTPVYLAAPGYKFGGVDPDLAREPFSIAPAVADLDGDGELEIVVSTYPGTIYVVGSDGKLKDGWPVRLPNVPSCPRDPTVPPEGPCMGEESILARGMFAAPVLADLDKDGKLDIIQAAFDGKIYVFDRKGKPVAGWPVELHYTGDLSEEPKRNRIMTTPAVADFNDDGIPDLVVGSNERLGSGEGAGAMYLLDGRGTKAPKNQFPNWPVTMGSLHLFPLVAEGVPNAAAIGSFGGKLAAVVHGNASAPLVLPRDPGNQLSIGGTPLESLPERVDPNTGKKVRGVEPTSFFGPISKATSPNTMFPLFAQPSLGDLDQDGFTDFVASGSSLAVAIGLAGGSLGGPAEHLLAMWSGKTGAMLPGAPAILEDFSFFNSHAIADLNGDDYPEVVTGSGGYFLHAYDACGREPKGWPKFTGQWIIPTPVVGDLDGDGTLEVATMTRSGWLYAWHTEGTEDSIIEWESFHHDNRNTGFLDTPLEQGGKHKAKKPLTASMCKKKPEHHEDEPPRPMVAGGGCDCTVGERGGASGLAASVLALLGLAAARGRRRGRSA